MCVHTCTHTPNWCADQWSVFSFKEYISLLLEEYIRGKKIKIFSHFSDISEKGHSSRTLAFLCDCPFKAISAIRAPSSIEAMKENILHKDAKLIVLSLGPVSEDTWWFLFIHTSSGSWVISRMKLDRAENTNFWSRTISRWPRSDGNTSGFNVFLVLVFYRGKNK